MDKSIKITRENSRVFYQKIGSIYCPYLSEKIYFSSEGFNHLRYRSARCERDHKTQYLRYRLLYLVPRLLALTHTLQEYEKRDSEAHSSVRFFGFIAILDHRKIKVIVKRVGDGRFHFWSIIPNWRTRKKSDQKLIQNHSGNLLDD